MKEVAEFFKGVKEIDGRDGIERLKVMNMLTLIDWFPSHLIRVGEVRGEYDKMVKVYLVNLIKHKGEQTIVIDESEYVEELTHLRNFLISAEH